MTRMAKLPLIGKRLRELQERLKQEEGWRLKLKGFSERQREVIQKQADQIRVLQERLNGHPIQAGILERELTAKRQAQSIAKPGGQANAAPTKATQVRKPTAPSGEPLWKRQLDKNFEFADWVMENIGGFKPDICLVHDSLGLEAARAVAEETGARLIYDAVEFPEYSGRSGVSARVYQHFSRGTRILHLHEKEIIERMDAILVGTRGVAEWFQAQPTFHDATIVRNCRVYEEMQPDTRIREDCGLGPDDKLILYPNGVFPTCGIEACLDAMEFLPDTVHIAIMGRMSRGMEVSLRKQMQKPHLEKRLHLLPLKSPDDLLQYRSGADLSLIPLQPDVPNHQTCLPNRVFESVMARLPLIISNLPYVREVVEEFDCGATFLSEDPREIARVLQESLADDRLAALKANVDKAAKALCWENEREVFLNGLKDVLPQDGRKLKILLVANKTVNTNNRYYRHSTALADLGHQLMSLTLEVPFPELQDPRIRYQGMVPPQQDFSGTLGLTAPPPSSKLVTSAPPPRSEPVEKAPMAATTATKPLAQPESTATAEASAPAPIPTDPAELQQALLKTRRELERREQQFERLRSANHILLHHDARKLPLWQRHARKTFAFAEFCEAALQDIDIGFCIAHDTYSIEAASALRDRQDFPILYDAIEVPDYRERSSAAREAFAVQKRGAEILLEYERSLLRQASSMMAVSPGLADVVAKLLGLDPPFVVRNCRRFQEKPQSNRLRELCNIPADAPVVLMLNRTNRGDGLEQTLEGMAGAPDHTHFILLGHAFRSDSGRSLEDLVADFGLSERLHQLDLIDPDKLIETISGADVTIIGLQATSPNNVISLPNRIFESVMARVPLAVTNLPDIRHIVEENELGVVFDPTNPRDIAAKLTEILEPGTLARFKKSVDRAAQEVLNWQQEQTQFVAAVEKALGGQRAPAAGKTVLLADKNLERNDRIARICQTLRDLGHDVLVCAAERPTEALRIEGVTYVTVADMEAAEAAAAAETKGVPPLGVAGRVLAAQG